MSTEEELTKWLSREEKTFKETIQFSIKAWKAVELTFPRKYEIILKWFCTNLPKEYGKNAEKFDWNVIEEFLNLHCSSGLISLEMKSRVPEAIIELANVHADKKECAQNRKIIEVIFVTSENTLIQSGFSDKPAIYCKLMGSLFTTYNNYIKSLKNMLPAYEAEFLSKVLKSFKAFFNRLPEPELFREIFKMHTLQSLVEFVILLKSRKLNYFEDFLEIERILYLKDDEILFTEPYLILPPHIILQNFECAIVHFRGYQGFFQQLLTIVFTEFPKITTFSSTGLRLSAVAHILNLFRKHDIQLNFKYSEEVTATQFIGEMITKYVDEYRKDYLPEVLKILCSALRLNPLILDQHIFEIVTKCLVARKCDKSWDKYQELLIILIDTFRKLSRGEKFVRNLLKSVIDYLKNNKISRKLKRKAKSECNDSIEKKKLKLDDLNNTTISIVNVEEDYENEFYLQELLNESKSFNQTYLSDESVLMKNTSWSSIIYAWPAHTVGLSFSKFVASLMSKPSIVIWKTLIYSFSECIDALDTSILDDNILFLIDFHGALLCQYLSGCRLAEQSDKFWIEIENCRTLTSDVLKKFGQTILNCEHNNRTMNTFLETSFHLGYFDLIRLYYCPDSIRPENIDILDIRKNIHAYLSQDEWFLIEQRIVNFGKNHCKANMNRLNLQKLKVQFLLLKKQDKDLDIQKILLSSTLVDIEQIKSIFNDPLNFWLLKHLTKDQKKQICDLFFTDASCLNTDFLRNFAETHEFLDLIIVNLYKYMAPCFTSKKSILSSINFDKLFAMPDNERIQSVVNAVNECTVSHSTKKYDPEKIESFLKIIAAMPIGFCKSSMKTFIFALNLALYKDLLATKDDNLIEICCNVFTDILHLGEPIKILKYLDIEIFISIFLPTKSAEIYEFMFNIFKYMVDDAEKCLIKFVEIFKSKENEINDEHLKLCTILIESLSHQTFIKKLKKYLDDFLEIYGTYINTFFASDNRDLSKDKEFVDKTLPAYTTYMNSFLGKATKSEIIDEQFRKVCKIYIGHSINCENSHAIKLISSSLLHRTLIHFDPDEIDFVLQKYWDQMIAEVQTSKNQDIKNMEAIVNFVINYKSHEEFAKILNGLEKELQSDKYEWICTVFSCISKCQQNTVKGAIFNDYFKRITFGMKMKLKRDDDNQFKEKGLILKLLDCQKSLCENQRIPISMGLIDDILSFLMDIDIKKFTITDTNTEEFFNLHQDMTAVCLALIKCRHLLMTDRIPHLMYVLKDLLQAVCWYKCNREKDALLEGEELDRLAETVQKLENLVHVIASHSVDVKKVAPYLLTFTIYLMVNNNRPTTLYPKIKTHIENICCDLISVCDHRVENFILRSSSDAMKQVYETLCKEYTKYRKFKGKV